MPKKRTILIALPLVLLAAIVCVLASDTLAAYVQSLRVTSSDISARTVKFFVNASTASEQKLGNMQIAPGESESYKIELDARGTEIPLDATLALRVSSKGNWPDGLSVSLNGETIKKNKTTTIVYEGIESTSPETATITVYWDASTIKDRRGNAYGHERNRTWGYTYVYWLLYGGDPFNLNRYRNFEMTLTVEVVAEQAG